MYKLYVIVIIELSVSMSGWRKYLEKNINLKSDESKTFPGSDTDTIEYRNVDKRNPPLSQKIFNYFKTLAENIWQPALMGYFLLSL